MPTKGDFVNFIRTNLSTPPRDAYDALGSDHLSKWANEELFGIEDRWFGLYQQRYDEFSLKNLILSYLNLPSLYDDFSDKKRIMGNQYREYLRIAQQVLKQSQDQLVSMENQKKNATDSYMIKILTTQIAIQKSTIDAQAANVATWDQTLRHALDNKEVI